MWTAMILSGGRSSRMGQSKSALQLHGRSMLDWVLATIPASVDVVVVGPQQAVCARMQGGVGKIPPVVDQSPRFLQDCHTSALTRLWW